MTLKCRNCALPVTVEVETPTLEINMRPGQAVDQPITFHVEVKNTDTKATDEHLSLIVETACNEPLLLQAIRPTLSRVRT